MATPGIVAAVLGLSVVALLNLAVLAFFVRRVWHTAKPRQQGTTLRTAKLAPAHR